MLGEFSTATGEVNLHGSPAHSVGMRDAYAEPRRHREPERLPAGMVREGGVDGRGGLAVVADESSRLDSLPGNRPEALGKQPAQGPFSLVICQDSRLLDVVMSAAASCGADPRVVREAHEVRRWWARAATVLIGAEMAPSVAGLGLVPRTGVHLIASDAEAATAWSVPLDASVLVLPEQSGFLPAVLSQSESPGMNRGRMIDVMGGTGGVGASTLAAALAQRCQLRQARPCLVDLDVCGGGIDLLLGAEKQTGWRWNDLLSVSGSVHDIASSLPTPSGFPVLSMGRTGAESSAALQAPGAQSVRSVLDSLCRNVDVVVIDDPEPQDWPGTEKAMRLVVVAAQVRAVMAARARIQRHGWQDAQLVVRCGPGMGLDPRAVADSLSLPLAGRITTDRRLVAAAQAGEPPGRRSGSRFAKQVDAIVSGLGVAALPTGRIGAPRKGAKHGARHA